MPIPLRPTAVLAPASLLALVVLLVACADLQPLPSDPTARLFARALDEIADLYIVPVSSRKLALAGGARLAQLDPKFSLSETPGSEDQTDIVLGYGRREVAAYPSPNADDPHVWGAWMGQLLVDAKAASPRLAALPQDQIEETLFGGITGALDRFSRYSTPQTAREQRAARDGFGGIGITLEDPPDPFRIAKVTPGGPADRAGIRAGDRIVAVGGAPTAGEQQSAVVRRLRGPVLSTVAIAVDRSGLGQARSYRLQRALIVEPTVTASRGDGVVIFRISGFNQNTTQQLVADLKAAERDMGSQLRGVVLDLRGDPGGLLDQAVSLADAFIAKGPIIATAGRNPASRQYFEASGDSIAPRLPIVVLVNGGSASASEIVAAALQDAGRAVVIGSASYGKGTVQTVLRLPNDGELILTWAQLIAPSGYSLNGHGVVPTVCTSDLGDDEEAVATALRRARGVSATSPVTDRARASLDEGGWSRLRRSCPARTGDPAIDLKVAERLLADPVLYSEALHVMTPASNLAAKPVGAAPALAGRPALTGAAGSLSSGARNP